MKETTPYYFYTMSRSIEIRNLVFISSQDKDKDKDKIIKYKITNINKQPSYINIHIEDVRTRNHETISIISFIVSY